MSHGHEHKHEHHHHSHVETVELSWANVKLESHTHEQAATVSLDIDPKPSCEKAFSDLVNIMQGIARAAEDAGGIVGHIKAFAKRGDASAHASVTAADLPPTCEGDQSLALDNESAVQLVAIVLLIAENDLLALCKNALPR